MKKISPRQVAEAGLIGIESTREEVLAVEAKLHGLPQFITEIDGLDIHFIHVRSKHENLNSDRPTSVE